MDAPDLQGLASTVAAWPPFFQALVGAGGLLAVLVVWLIARAKKRVDTGGTVKGSAAGAGSLAARAVRVWGGLADALHYFAHRREWRYRVPWLLLLGEPASGKTSIAASAGSPRRESLSADEAALALPGTRWWFFERGVLIDLENDAAPGGTGLTQRTGWSAVVRGLFNHRPERPIDGVVLTVSARSLLNATSADLQRLADDNYSRLVELQRRFEFTFPVYVVISQCDAVEGFDAFWSRQGADRRREMVGWSNPHTLDGNYLPGWNDEVFDETGAALKRLQTQVAADATAGAHDVDRFFLFPQRLRELRAPLGAVLEGIFRPSAFHANFFFRGVYFTGAVGGEGMQRPKPREDVSFVDALLDEKAFAEVNLARANRQGVLSRHQAIRRIQLGIVGGFALLCTWLAVAANDLNHQIDNTIAALHLMKDAPSGSVNGHGCVSKEAVYALLEQVSRIDLDYGYAPIPASWVDSRHADDESRYVADTAFEKVIFPGLRCHLEARARTLVEAEPMMPDAALPAHEAAARLRDGLIAQARALDEFEHHLDLYVDIVSEETEASGEELLVKFEALAMYLYGEPLPAAVANKKGQHLAALEVVVDETPVALPENLRRDATDAVLLRAQKTHEELFRRLARGREYLQTLELDGPPHPSDVTGLIAWTHWVQSDWLATGGGDLCRQMESNLQPVLGELRGHGGYVGTGGADIAQAAGWFTAERCFAMAKVLLGTLEAPPHGPLFLSSERGLTASPAVAVELEHLESLAALRFMQRVPRDGFVCRAPVRNWDTDRLAEATDALREFEQWLARGGDVAGTLHARTLAERVARRQIDAVVADILAGAQNPFRLGDSGDVAVSTVATLDEQVRQQSTDFARAMDPLVMVIQVLRQRGFEASATRISQCARDFASDTLHSIDALAASSRLYAPNFSMHGAAGADTLLMASLGTEAEAKDYLKRQLQRGQVLGGYAAPFVAFLLNTEGVDDTRAVNRETAAYWSNTIGELNRYVQFKEPNGQVAHLDTLFLKQLSGLSVANCGTQLAAYQVPAYGNDLFSAHRSALERLVSARCSDRKEAATYTGYQALAREFNQTLAGRFPFGPDPQREASVVAVKKFLLDYTAQRDALRADVKGLKGERWRQVDAFLDKLDAVAGFFGSNLAAGETSKPVRINVGFRANAEQSPGSEQVVEWRFRSGRDVAAFPNRTHELDWQFSHPVAPELDWAENSRMAPVVDPSQRHLQVERYTAKFAAEGPWSLLKLLHAHAARTLPRQDVLDPTTLLLEFEVPVSEKSAGRPAAELSRMYLTMQLLGQDPQTKTPAPLRLPELFPHYAPMAW